MRQISQTAMEGFRIVAGGFTPRSARIYFKPIIHIISRYFNDPKVFTFCDKL